MDRGSIAVEALGPLRCKRTLGPFGAPAAGRCVDGPCWWERPDVPVDVRSLVEVRLSERPFLFFKLLNTVVL